MRVNEKQLLIMLRVLEGSLRMLDGKDGSLFGYDLKTRNKTFADIINQRR